MLVLPVLVRRTVQRLICAFAPERIILFGSYAKGTNRFDSDVDLLVVAEVEGDRATHERRARQLSSDCFPPIDVVLCTPAEAAEADGLKSPFLLSILGTGITIYGRS
jgi:predicted nucleotidyltransferase